MGGSGELVGGRYRLDVQLGRGGMGEVWRAVDTRLDRPVAVKLLPPSHADADGVHRFLREARVTARLQHPGIVQVFDRGEQDGRLHLVMELLRGRDLGALLREQPRGLPVRQALDLAAQAAEALSYAHGMRIVHRDVKPANLMLLPDGRLKVCDFGLVGFARAGSGLTQEGTVLGTPAYMAPEQCRSKPVDGRADLYALGCVLFALLTGRPPFAGRGDFLAIALDHISTVPPRVTELRQGLSPELDDLVARLLAKSPDDRPATAGVVADRLRTLALGDPDAAPAREQPRVTTAPRRPQPPQSGFAVEVFQNEYLSPDATDAHAILTVSAAGVAPRDLAAAAPRAIVFLLGMSGTLHPTEFRTAVDAVAASIDQLDAGARFAVVAGAEYARMLYPDTMRLVRATPETKAEARAALARLEPAAKLAYGRWLRLADRLLSGHPDAVRTAIQLMDLPDEAESADELAAALAVCTGRFTCHVRGLGENWEVSHARAVSSALGGTMDIVRSAADPSSGVRQDLAQILARTRQSAARDLALRVTSPEGVELRHLKQVAPTVESLTEGGQFVAAGAWECRVFVPEGESCDYHLHLTVPRGRVGERWTAAVVELIQLPPAGDGQTLARAVVEVEPAEDLELSTRINAQVAHYTGQAELAEAIRRGLEERGSGST